MSDICSGDKSLYDRSSPLLDVMGKVRIFAHVSYIFLLLMDLCDLVSLLSSFAALSVNAFSNAVKILLGGGWQRCCHEAGHKYDDGQVKHSVLPFI